MEMLTQQCSITYQKTWDTNTSDLETSHSATF